MLIFILLDKVFNTTFFDFIYEVLQSPLQGVTDSLGGALLLGFVIPLFWFSVFTGQQSLAVSWALFYKQTL